jgi:hypothetical protein
VTQRVSPYTSTTLPMGLVSDSSSSTKWRRGSVTVWNCPLYNTRAPAVVDVTRDRMGVRGYNRRRGSATVWNRLVYHTLAPADSDKRLRGSDTTSGAGGLRLCGTAHGTTRERLQAATSDTIGECCNGLGGGDGRRCRGSATVWNCPLYHTRAPARQ